MTSALLLLAGLSGASASFLRQQQHLQSVAVPALFANNMSEIHNYYDNLDFTGLLGEKGDGQCLKFVHVPKNGGTTIEDLSEHAVNWGRNDEHLYNLPRTPCCGWHIPPMTYAELGEHYTDCHTFVVIRNPVSRLISEYAWTHGTECQYQNDFEDWIRERLDLAQEKPYYNDCHLLPQWVYAVRPDGNYYQQHVVFYEDFNNQFDNLMVKFGYDDVQLPPKSPHSSECYRTKITLSNDVMDLIVAHYRGDFEVFGYDIEASRHVERLSPGSAPAS